jgi:hypothetical protein
MVQLSSKTSERLGLPPFRSAKEFPASPRIEKAEALYPELLQAVRDSNQARAVLRNELDAKRVIMDEIRKEVNRYQQDLALEASARMRLHKMNEVLVKTLAEIDEFTNELSGVVVEAHRSKRNGLGGLIDKLKALPDRWKAFKAAQRQAIASALRASDDPDSHE